MWEVKRRKHVFLHQYQLMVFSNIGFVSCVGASHRSEHLIAEQISSMKDSRLNFLPQETSYKLQSYKQLAACTRHVGPLLLNYGSLWENFIAFANTVC